MAVETCRRHVWAKLSVLLLLSPGGVEGDALSMGGGGEKCFPLT